MKKSIRVLALMLILVLCLSLVPVTAAQEEPKVVLSSQNLSVNGEEITCEKYNIDGSNYFKLRDMAYLLRDTCNRFSVGWDETTKTVTVTSGEAYTPNGSELVLREDQSGSASRSSQTIMVNGSVCDTLTVYNIGGNNFFQLRQLGTLLGFAVDYNGETNTAGVTSVYTVETKTLDGGYQVVMPVMPGNLEELKCFDLADEYQAAAALVCTLAMFETDSDTAMEMLDYIMGPEAPSDRDRNFILEQLRQYPYVMRSYFEGAVPGNGYTVGACKLIFMENLYSRTEDGYVTLYSMSSGADSARSFKLRQKKSTGEWFLFSDTYKGLMAGIVPPVTEDAVPEEDGPVAENFTVTTEKTEGGYQVNMTALPKSMEELRCFDLTDEYQTAAALICTLAMFETDSDTGMEMLDYIMGSEAPSNFDRNFIAEQLRQYPYVVRSYFEGAAPENDYTVGAAQLLFLENLYSRDEDGYVVLYCKSSGADSVRGFKLIQKSTGKWYLFSDTYKGLLSGIVLPASADPWA